MYKQGDQTAVVPNVVRLRREERPQELGAVYLDEDLVDGVDSCSSLAASASTTSNNSRKNLSHAEVVSAYLCSLNGLTAAMMILSARRGKLRVWHGAKPIQPRRGAGKSHSKIPFQNHSNVKLDRGSDAHLSFSVWEET
jgi:hypothetical protein